MAAPVEFTLVKNSKAKSTVWEHFALKKRKNDGRIEDNVAVCRMCDGNVKCTGGGTSNLMSHLRRHHAGMAGHPSATSMGSPRPISDTKDTSSKSTTHGISATGIGQQSISSMFATRTKYRADSAKAKAITGKIARFIVNDLRPYKIVETKEFKEMVQELDPRYRLPCRKQFTEITIPLMYNKVKQEVVSAIKSSSQVAITSDAWTSRNTESFVTVTATMIVDWELVNLVLQTRPMPESHTAENIAVVIQAAVDEWKLPTSLLGGAVPPIVSDNAANMLKAGRVLECTCHIGCLAHTLNLAVQKALKVHSVSQLLARVRNVVSFFHRSSVAASILRSKAEMLGLPHHKLKTDVCTRWNSAYDMLTRFLEMQAAVVATLTSNQMTNMRDRGICTLNYEQLVTAQEVSAVLKPLKDITTMLCTEKLPTVSIVMPLIYRLTHAILKQQDTDSPIIASMKQIMREDLNSRYTDKADFLNMASAMDPRFKQLPYLSDADRFSVFVSLTEKTVQTASSVRPTHTETAVTVKVEKADHVPEQMVVDDSETDPPLPALPVLPTLEEDEQVVPTSKESTTKQETAEVVTTCTSSVLDDILGDVFVTRVEPAKSVQELAEIEVSQYKSETAIRLSENPLVWWKSRECKYPLLSTVAKCVLCIPATSVPSERVFSTAGDILTAQRASLKAKHVDMLIFLKKNMK